MNDATTVTEKIKSIHCIPTDVKTLSSGIMLRMFIAFVIFTCVFMNTLFTTAATTGMFSGTWPFKGIRDGWPATSWIANYYDPLDNDKGIYNTDPDWIENSEAIPKYTFLFSKLVSNFIQTQLFYNVIVYTLLSIPLIRLRDTINYFRFNFEKNIQGVDPLKAKTVFNMFHLPMCLSEKESSEILSKNISYSFYVITICLTFMMFSWVGATINMEDLEPDEETVKDNIKFNSMINLICIIFLGLKFIFINNFKENKTIEYTQNTAKFIDPFYNSFIEICNNPLIIILDLLIVSFCIYYYNLNQIVKDTNEIKMPTLGIWLQNFFKFENYINFPYNFVSSFTLALMIILVILNYLKISDNTNIFGEINLDNNIFNINIISVIFSICIFCFILFYAFLGMEQNILNNFIINYLEANIATGGYKYELLLAFFNFMLAENNDSLYDGLYELFGGEDSFNKIADKKEQGDSYMNTTKIICKAIIIFVFALILYLISLFIYSGQYNDDFFGSKMMWLGVSLVVLILLFMVVLLVLPLFYKDTDDEINEQTKKSKEFWAPLTDFFEKYKSLILILSALIIIIIISSIVVSKYSATTTVTDNDGAPQSAQVYI